MEGEERVVLGFGQERVLWQRQLNTEQERQYTTDEEEGEPVQEVEDTDFFVIGCGQPRLEVRPEVLDGEGARGTGIEHVEDAEEHEAEGESNRSHQDHQCTGAWGDIASVYTGDDKVCLIPIVATGTCTAVYCVAVNCDFNNLAVVGWSDPLKVPRSDGVGLCSVRKAPVHVVTE